MAKNILFIVGSLRARSFNRQLAQNAAELVRAQADVSFLEWADVPLFSQDAEFPLPPSVARVRKEVQTVDGIWIFSPEYNGTIPGTLKNLLDWLSRPLVPGDFSSGTAVAGKTVTVSGVGGKSATRFVRADLQKLLAFMRMRVVCGEGTGYAADAAAFQTDKLTLTEENVALLASQATEFLAAV
ncbi:MAG: NAD(P)H-dependent oxidoreductase [Treponemataceae bacterium]|nr:NAD(P)H-dependent oxidoreductase [Treponemataceae bacterium]